MMHLCECGCGRAADNAVSSMSSHELAGARYRLACADGGLFQRIRQRRQAAPYLTVEDLTTAPPVESSEHLRPLVTSLMESDRDHWEPFKKAIEEATRAICGAFFLPMNAIAKLLAPDPYRAHAMALNIDEETVGERTAEGPGQAEASLRMQRADARDRPRSTATSRELAKPHPSTWPSQDGEP